MIVRQVTWLPEGGAKGFDHGNSVHNSPAKIKEYTDYHGYRLVFFTEISLAAEDRPSRWSTVLALLNVLQYQPEVDHVSWTDSDSASA